MFWIVFGVIAVLLVAVWVWTDLRQPPGRDPSEARLNAWASSHTRNMYEDRPRH